MSQPLITFVVARADNGVIGSDGRLPWRLRSDMHHFRRVTMGKPMIMGRKTFESLPRVLDGRRHIVLTRDPDWHAEGAEVVHDIKEALETVQGLAEATVIGGAEVFRLFLPYAGQVWLTEVHCEPDGDTFLPPFNDGWREIGGRTPGLGEGPPHDFVLLERIR
ncbi:MAG TPA: dihydrofolate reductase [Allosphingosinicella sp.]|jgi:dihydrofolate reductase